MLLLFMGPTASGKTTLMQSFCNKKSDTNEPHYVPVVRYTTRDKRVNEIDGVDYYFVSLYKFNRLLADGAFIEYEEYSDNRLYGTTISSLQKNNLMQNTVLCSTITPSGLIQICNTESMSFGNVLVVYCKCDLATQIIRYVSRMKDFNVTDKLEMCDRLARDEGMFKNIEGLFNLCKKTYNGKFISLLLDSTQSIETNMNIIDTTVKNEIYTGVLSAQS